MVELERRDPRLRSGLGTPGIDDVDAAVPEVDDVSRREGSSTQAGYGRDLRVELSNTSPQAFARGGHRRVVSGRVVIERKHAVAKVPIEDDPRRVAEPLPTPPSGRRSTPKKTSARVIEVVNTSKEA